MRRMRKFKVRNSKVSSRKGLFFYKLFIFSVWIDCKSSEICGTKCHFLSMLLVSPCVDPITYQAKRILLKIFTKHFCCQQTKVHVFVLKKSCSQSFTKFKKRYDKFIHSKVVLSLTNCNFLQIHTFFFHYFALF